MYKFLLFLTASALPGVAAAQSADSDPAEAALAEIVERQDAARQPVELPDGRATQPVTLDAATITVTATGLGTTIQSTGQAVVVIDRKEIEQVQGADITRVLQRTPGLSLSRNGGAGSFTGVNLRGANAEQLLVLVDGVRVADPASPSGGFDFGNLLTGTVGKLDLLRGSNSTIWGSDAIGGVLDIATCGGSGVQGSFEYGARDTRFAQAAGGLETGALALGLTGSWFATDGFSAAANGTEPDGFEQFALGGSVFADVTDQLEVFAHANWSEGTLDIDGFAAPSFTLGDTAETQDTRRLWGDVGFAYYGNDLTLRAAYSMADTERDNFDPAAGSAPTFASDGHSERVQLRGEYRVLGGLSVAFGGEREWTAYSTSFNAREETGISGAYVQLGWVMGRLAAHIGSRIDDHDIFGTKTSFGADVSYGLGSDWRVRASVGEGFKAPTLFQLLSDFGNPRLRPEESTSFDIGIEQGQRGRGTHLALTAFRRDSADLIAFVSCFGATGGLCTDRPFGTYANTASARAQGIEAEAGIAVAEGFRLSAVYSLIDAEDRISGNELARRPRHSATLFADYEAAFGLRLGADLRLVSDSFDNAANSIRLDNYAVFDLRAAMPVSDVFEVFGRVENLFAENYQTAAGYASPGRGAFIGVRAAM
ncbi:TonB-dependent receptor plug domain-containing protein [Qipengyuania marisflavi]|uniref:TonB-dependent receptor n=1 Tax=Qipengyuania marisflavi TaxID=2486356 RepID=A0A5S3P9M7_9SPHN|nr:TonB-dependent receptor [Qipengyuania marisflavi]TMM50204.1 TonB-dependent receptor [Qipengyuania marisflavi]